MDDKKTQILKAAMRVVSAYGFKRTSMEDIAQEAGVSRPAIYQLFRNKDDVFLSCIDMVIEDAFDVAKAAIVGVTGAKAQVAAYLTAYMGYYHQLLVTGPHGQELLDVNSRLGAGQTKQAQARFIKELNRMMGQGADAEAGHILTLAASGIKFQTADATTLRARLTTLVERFVE